MQTSSQLKFISFILFVLSSNIYAADWLTLQGTEEKYIKSQKGFILNTNTKPKTWGFIQANYRMDFEGVFVAVDGKNKIPFPLLNPNLQNQSGFNISRARLAVRGMIDKQNKVNYFFMTEQCA